MAGSQTSGVARLFLHFLSKKKIVSYEITANAATPIIALTDTGIYVKNV
jgi:hypothetical protein